MLTVEIIVMGKTGTGKSTLINAVLEESLAPTGIGQAITKENHVYSKVILIEYDESENSKYQYVPYEMKMCDTVGLEIDSSITNHTLNELRKHIITAKASLKRNDICVVWFCINERCSKIEDYELDLIKGLSEEYELPFLVVITQSLSKKNGDLETAIASLLPNTPIAKVLAEAYPVDDDLIIPAHGVKELLKRSIRDYQIQKIQILEKKADALSAQRMQRIEEIKYRGERCIEKHSSTAKKIGTVPGGCIPFVHGICIQMITELDKIAGLKGDKATAEEILPNILLGLVMSAFMIVPVFSRNAAMAYIKTVGDSYLRVLLAVIDHSTDQELRNNSLITERIKGELKRLKQK